MKKYNKRDACVYYDYGDTAPREYGVFCKRTKDRTTFERCSKCKFYKNKKVINE